MAQRPTLALLTAVSLLATANAQFGGFPGGFGNGGGGGGPFGNNGNGNGNSNSDPSSSGFSQGSLFSSTAEFNKVSRILIVHAVLASAVWVLFIPSLAILLRLNLKNPIVLKIHAVGQVLSYIIFIAAAGMGIWLAQQFAAFGVWEDPHPKLGLAILAIAFFQPIFGMVHHSLYKKRTQNIQAGLPTKPPGRTAIGRVHLWVGRLLIVLGMINGGLGIRLASFSPLQSQSTSNKAKVAYGVVTAVMFVLYLFFVIVFEVKRAQRQDEEVRARGQGVAPKDNLPTYDESEESVGRSTLSSVGRSTQRHS